MKTRKQSPLPNPVLHFGSSTYRCKKFVVEKLDLARKQRDASDQSLDDALRAAMADNITGSTLKSWCREIELTVWDRFDWKYETIRTMDTPAGRVAKEQFLAGEISFRVAYAQILPARKPRTPEQILDHAIDRLAACVVNHKFNPDQVVRQLRQAITAKANSKKNYK